MNSKTKMNKKPAGEKKSGTMISNNWIKKNSVVLSILLIIILTLAAYSNSIKNGFVMLDDNVKVTENTMILSLNFSHILKYFSNFVFHTYMPLTILSYAIDYSLWGMHPSGFHAANLLLHVFNSVLVFVFIKKLCGKNAAALIASLLFAINPINVESVSWISERSNVLFAAFFLISLLFYLKHSSEASGKKNLYLSLLFFILSVLAKPVGVTLPLALIAIDYYKGSKINFKSILQKAPFFLISLAFGILTIYATIVTDNVRDISSSFNFADRIFLSSYPLAFYFVKFILPFDLSALHPYPVKTGGWLPWEYYVSLLFVLFVILLIWKSRSYKKDLAFGGLFYIANVFIYLVVIPAGGDFLVAEHFAYIPCIGFAAAAGLLYIRATESNPTFKIIIPVFIAAVVLLFSYSTYKQNFVWENSKSLFTDMLIKSPDNAFANYAFATLKLDDNDYSGAIAGFTKAINCDSTYSDAYYNRALAKRANEEYAESLSDFDKAILYNPEKYDAYSNRGNIKLILKDSAGAMKDYDQSIKINPEYAFAYYNRGIIKLNQNELSEALKDFTKAIELKVDYTEAYNNRGITKYFLKDYPGSIKDYSAAIFFRPGNASAYKNRGLSKLALKDSTAACDDFYKAFAYDYKIAGMLIKKYCRSYERK
jgi:tetratricopeptide (TPR) repeat protein